MGYDLIEGYDGYNDNKPLDPFGYAIPFTHTGVKASYAFLSKIAAMVEVVNGWDLLRYNNRSKDARRPAHPGSGVAAHCAIRLVGGRSLRTTITPSATCSTWWPFQTDQGADVGVNAHYERRLHQRRQSRL